MIVVVMEGRDDAEPGLAHIFQRVFRRQFTLPENFRLVRVDPALGEGFADGRWLRPAGRPNVDRVRVGVLGALHEGGEILVRHRIARRADDLTAALPEAVVTGGLAAI